MAPPSQMRLAGLIGVLARVGGAYLVLKNKTKDPIRRNDPEGCIDIIQAKVLRLKASSGYPFDTLLKNTIPSSEARAKPDSRLIHAFGVDNCVTSGDRKRCSVFKTEARNLVNLTDDQWMVLASHIRHISVEKCTQSSEAPLFDIVHLVTMKAALEPLLSVDISSSTLDDDISQLANEINKQWLRSKETRRDATAFVAQDGLNSALRTIVPGWDGVDKTSNPLNLILPGYETLWRVVLRCFIEVVFRAGVRNVGWKKALEDFAKYPTSNKLSTIEGMEIRIYRQFETTDKGEIEVAADIEACHRNKSIWGEDALEFDPSRWIGECESKTFKEANFMPFGADPFACVAKQSAPGGGLPFGVSMIAVLVGALSLAVDDSFELVDDRTWEEKVAPLSSDREAYGELHIKKLL